MLRLFSTAVFAQALISAANFTVGLLLIRYAASSEYGYYVLAFSSLQLLTSAQAAWIGGPLMVLSARQEADRARQMVGSVEYSHRRVLRVLAPLVCGVPAGAALAGLWPMHHALIASAAVLAGWMGLRRELMRTCHMIYARPHSVMRADAVYAATLVVLALTAATLSSAPALYSVLSLAGAAALGAAVGRRSFARATGWHSRAQDPVWREMQPLAIWSLIGAVTYWIYSQSYNFILASSLDIDAVAHVNAARLMLMPIVLLMVGVGSLLVPQAARWLNREGVGVMMRRLWTFLVGLLILAAIYVAVLWNLRDWVVEDVMRKPIPGLDLLLMLWTVQLLLSMTRDVFQAGLAAMGRFESMAWITGLATVLSLGATWFGIANFGAAGALVGTISGEMVSLLGVFAMLLRGRRAAMQARVREPDGGADGIIPAAAGGSENLADVANPLLPDRQTMPALNYALITPSFRGDFERCRMLVESVVRWVSAPMAHYLVVDRRDLELFRALEGPRTRILVVEDIIPWWLIRIPGLPKVWLSLRSPPVRNWILQQIVKLSIAEHVSEDVLLFADSDTFFVRDFDPRGLERDGRPPLFVEYGQRGLIQNNDRWHQVAARLLGIAELKSYDTNFIGNVICWRRDHALALLQRLAKVGGRDWRLTLVNQFVFSEYILYGLFASEVLGSDHCQQWQDTVIRTHTHWEPRPLDEAELVAFRNELQPHHHSVMISAKSRTPVELIRRVFA